MTAATEHVFDDTDRLRLLIDAVTDYAIYMLDADGLVTSWNSGAERIKGYRSAEILGQHFSRFYTEPDRAAGMPARVLRTASEEGRFEDEAWRVRKDGSLFWAHVIVDPIRDRAGRLVGFAKVTRDLTERRNAQLALERAQAERQEAQKMEALGHLTGGVAHDFNNLLMVIDGHIHTLRRIAGQDPAAARAIDAIDKASRRGESLTRQLLSFSRRQTLNPVAADIGERIEAVRALLQTSLGGALNLATSIPRDVWQVRIDVSEFDLALLNIAMNARDALPQGGAISVAVENVRLAPGDTPAGLSGDYVAVAVSDTGAGIAPDILPKVFDPFFTTKKDGKGTGLGLSQVHGFAHQSGGTVTIRSSLGHGTTITLYLPRVQGDPPPGAEARADTGADGNSVLLVEDNPDVAEVSQSLLEQLGYRVHLVADAHAALDTIERQHGTFDLVVSDIIMAGPMDGLGLARRLRERYPDLAVMLVTGYSDLVGSVGTEFPVLRKPYQLADLHRATAAALARPARGGLSPRPDRG
jgi:PAS domain S-box-containing protein